MHYHVMYLQVILILLNIYMRHAMHLLSDDVLIDAVSFGNIEIVKYLYETYRVKITDKIIYSSLLDLNERIYKNKITI